jgi:hypothetical protein
MFPQHLASGDRLIARLVERALLLPVPTGAHGSDSAINTVNVL